MLSRKHQITSPVDTSNPAAPTARPDPEGVPAAKRRTFSNAEKLRILAAADACQTPGEISALLRREGIYSPHLATWRKQRKSAAA